MANAFKEKNKADKIQKLMDAYVVASRNPSPFNACAKVVDAYVAATETNRERAHNILGNHLHKS